MERRPTTLMCCYISLMLEHHALVGSHNSFCSPCWKTTAAKLLQITGWRKSPCTALSVKKRSRERERERENSGSVWMGQGTHNPALFLWALEQEDGTQTGIGNKHCKGYENKCIFRWLCHWWHTHGVRNKLWEDEKTVCTFEKYWNKVHFGIPFLKDKSHVLFYSIHYKISWINNDLPKIYLEWKAGGFILIKCMH